MVISTLSKLLVSTGRREENGVLQRSTTFVTGVWVKGVIWSCTGNVLEGQVWVRERGGVCTGSLPKFLPRPCMYLLQTEKVKSNTVAVMEVDQREQGRLLGVVQARGSSKEWSRQARERGRWERW
jgi:hypothetical protein